MSDSKVEATSNSYRLIDRKLTGTVRDSSLFNYIEDNQDLACLRNYHLERIYRQGDMSHPAWLVRLPLTEETPCYKDGFRIKEHHLSIDKRFTREESPYARGFTCAHYSAYLENPDTGEEEVLHVYFNRNGVEVRFDGGRYLPGEIKQAQDAQGVLKELIKAKNLAYLDLYEASFIKSEELAKSFDSELWSMRSAELVGIYESLNRYNDEVIDSRQYLLEEQIARREQKRESVAIESKQDDVVTKENTPITTKNNKHKQRQKDKKQKKKQTITVLQEKVQALLKAFGEHEGNSFEQNLSTFLSLPHGLQRDFFDAHLYALDLNPSDCEILASLPFSKNQLMQHFNAALKRGDLNTFQAIYSVLSNHESMVDVYRDLIDAIFAKRASQAARPEDLIEIAKYLTDCSPMFRMLMMLKTNAYHFSEDLTVGLSLLLETFMENNFTAFSYLLEEHVSPDQVQVYLTQRGLTALPALTFMYALNPDIRYVYKLLEHGASLDIDIKLYHSDVMSLDTQNNALKKADRAVAKKLQQVAEKSNYSHFERIDNALTFGISENKQLNTELLEVLAERSSLGSLVQAAVLILCMRHFRMLTSVAEPLDNKYMDLYSSREEAAATMQQSDNHLRFAFYPSLDNTTKYMPELTAGAKILLKHISEKDKSTPRDEKVALMDAFIAKGNQAFLHVKNKNEALNHYITALACYSLIDDPGAALHIKAVDTLRKYGNLFETKTPGTKGVFHQVGLQILSRELASQPQNFQQLRTSKEVKRFIDTVSQDILARFPELQLIFSDDTVFAAAGGLYRMSIFDRKPDNASDATTHDTMQAHKSL